MPVHVPVDGETVWVRRWVFVPAFEAVWDLATQSFVHSSGLVISWEGIWRWKHVVEP
jgi:hypothetical protein